MGQLNNRVKQLEKQVNRLLSKVANLSANTEEKSITPYSISGAVTRGTITPIDAKSGLGASLGNHVIWNNSEIKAPLNAPPASPKTGYNKHSHSRYSGGALIKDNLEVVEYDWDKVTPQIDNRHSQQFWVKQPDIKTEEIIVDGRKIKVDKIGKLELVFNPNGGEEEVNIPGGGTQIKPKGTWGVAAYEINVEQCYLVKRAKVASQGVEIGDILKDSKNQEMKSPLLVSVDASGSETPAVKRARENENLNKSNVYWDEDAVCWRLYSVFKPAPEEEPEP